MRCHSDKTINKIIALRIAILFSAALTARGAWAQDAVQAASASQWLLNPGAEHSQVISSGELLARGQFRFALHTHLQLAPTLQLREHLTAAWAPLERLQLLAQLPLVLLQRPAPSPEIGLGRPWAGLRVGLLAPQWDDGWFLALEASAGLPGLEHAEPSTRSSAPTGLLRVSAGVPLSSGVVGFEASGRVGSNLALVGGGLTFAAQGTHLGGELSARADVSVLGAPRAFFEVLAGARYRLRPIELSLLGGPGYTPDASTVTGRLVFALAFINPGEEESSAVARVVDCTEGTAYRLDACPNLDWDHDGINNGVDHCPREYGPKENAGCPWSDADDDTVIDRFDNCPTVPGPVSNAGCPLSTPQKVVIREERLEILERVFFEFDKAIIKPESFGLLEQVAAVMLAHPELPHVRVEGHTDHVGSAAYNQTLSTARAQAVRQFLIEHGVAPERLSARGYGFEHPLASNDDDEGRAQNRRVEFLILRQAEPQ